MDLTDAVVDAARNAPPVVVDVPMAKLQGPPDIRLDPATKTLPDEHKPAPIPTGP